MMNEQLCRTCAYRSDGINTLSLDYCYCLDKEITRSDPGCPEWRGSLRDEPLNDPPMSKEDT